MRTMNDEAFGAWVSEVDETLRKLYLSLSKSNYPDSVIAAILQSATRPFYYFEKEWVESKEDKKLHRGRTRTDDRHPPFPEQTKAASQAATSPRPVSIRVTGNTKPHKEWLKSFGLRWSPDNQWWHGTVNEFLTFKRAAEEKNLTVVMEKEAVE